MADTRPLGHRLELAVERVIMGSRWLQAPLYIGLVFVLGVVVVKFPFKLWDLVQRALIVEEGDLVVFRTAGAYAAAMSSTYNSRPLTPEVLVDGERWAVVRPRIDIDRLIAADRIPDWLGGCAGADNS